jgi:hypothetical protein
VFCCVENNGTDGAVDGYIIEDSDCGAGTLLHSAELLCSIITCWEECAETDCEG